MQIGVDSSVAMCKIVSTRLVPNDTLPLADTKKKGGAYTYNNEV